MQPCAAAAAAAAAARRPVPSGPDPRRAACPPCTLPQLMQCKPLSEAEVKALCEKAREIFVEVRCQTLVVEAGIGVG